MLKRGVDGNGSRFLTRKAPAAGCGHGPLQSARLYAEHLYLRQPREPAAEERVRPVNGRAGDSDADGGLWLRQRGLAGSADELQRQRDYL